jgi:hypothetical protein
MGPSKPWLYRYMRFFARARLVFLLAVYVRSREWKEKSVRFDLAIRIYLRAVLRKLFKNHFLALVERNGYKQRGIAADIPSTLLEERPCRATNRGADRGENKPGEWSASGKGSRNGGASRRPPLQPRR